MNVTYREIFENQSVHPVKLKNVEEASEEEFCECQSNDRDPCGATSSCFLRYIAYKCGLNCAAGERCQNKPPQKRDYAKMELEETDTRGIGAFLSFLAL